MVQRINEEELRTAWRALAGGTGEGWRTIQVAINLPAKVRAGRHFPGNEESLLVGFTAAHVPPSSKLPQGKGFMVSRVELGPEGGSLAWIALSRLEMGNLDLFAVMSEDILGAIASLHKADEITLLRAFLTRITSWQDFMERGRPPVLSREAELGLFGEIFMLSELLASGLQPDEAVEAWVGPLDGIQDFEIGQGAVEVKSTLSANGFLAKISSIDQLDDSRIQPLFLAGVRLTLDPLGQSLPDLVVELAEKLAENAAALSSFGGRLLRAGFSEAYASQYERRFTRTGMKIFPVNGTFPRLTRANVPLEIRDVRYDLDLDLLTVGEIGLNDALIQLGVI